MTDDDNLRSLEEGIEGLRQRPVKIVVTSSAAEQGAPVAVEVSGAPETGTGTAGPPVTAGRARRWARLHRPELVNGGGVVVTAGLIVPAIIFPHVGVLMAIGVAVLGATGTNIMNSLSQKGKAS
jgi:hypothetical protein